MDGSHAINDQLEKGESTLMKNLLKFIPISLTLLIITISCGGNGGGIFGGGSDCSDQVNDMINRNGNPEDTNAYNSDDYHSYTYWYWCKGFSQTFTWGKNVDRCESSVYTFSSICK